MGDLQSDSFHAIPPLVPLYTVEDEITHHSKAYQDSKEVSESTLMYSLVNLPGPARLVSMTDLISRPITPIFSPSPEHTTLLELPGVTTLTLKGEPLMF